MLKMQLKQSTSTVLLQYKTMNGPRHTTLTRREASIRHRHDMPVRYVEYKIEAHLARTPRHDDERHSETRCLFKTLLLSADVGSHTS